MNVFPQVSAGMKYGISTGVRRGLVQCMRYVYTSAVLRLECSLDCLSAPTLWRYDVTETYSHVVRQNLQKRKLRVLNPARIHVFYWFNWLNLIGS